MIKLLMMLPNWLLLILSRKKQIEMGKRKLHPPFQLLLKLTENLITDFDTLTPEQFRIGYLEQNRITSKFGIVLSSDALMVSPVVLLIN